MASPTHRVIAPPITNFIATLWRHDRGGPDEQRHCILEFLWRLLCQRRPVCPTRYTLSLPVYDVPVLRQADAQVRLPEMLFFWNSEPPSSQAYSHPNFNFYRPEELSLIRTERTKSQQAIDNSQSVPEITPAAGEYPLYLFESVERLSRVQAELSPQLEILESHSREMEAVLEDMRYAYSWRASWLAYITETLQAQLVYQ
ncbi:hypothetical protein BDZ89DRAFT_1128125 [Hymenopellis radicata]|nr:hypothetical protein BDZ89DRAFT_1128125 [Hymenopellis radicata]